MLGRAAVAYGAVMPTRPGAKTPINGNTAGRFLSIEQVAAELNITNSQSYALLQPGRPWAVRVERTRLERGDLLRDRDLVDEHPMAAGNVWARRVRPPDPARR